MPIVASSRPRAEVLMSRQQQTRIFFPLLFPFSLFFLFFSLLFSNLSFFPRFSSVPKFNGGTNFLYSSLDRGQTSFVLPPSLIVSITPRLPFKVLYKYFHRKNQRIIQRKRFNYSKIDVHNYCTHRPELEIVYTFWNFKKKKRTKLESYRHRKKFVKYYRPLLKSKNKLST